MLKSASNGQRGFTLIEMSIVLVIIGLIIGGILKGQELIDSSRQKNLINSIDHIKADTTTFVDRYKSMPGDFSRVTLLPNSGLLTAGNDDGVVGAVATGTTAALANLTGVTTAGKENNEFFNQMLAAGLGSAGTITSAAPACFSGLCTTPSPLPSGAYPQSGLWIVYGFHAGANLIGPSSPLTTHWLSFSRFFNGALGATTATGAVISAQRASQLDNKYDDGIAGTGSIRSTDTGNCTGAAGYAAATTTVDCSLLFAME